MSEISRYTLYLVFFCFIFCSILPQNAASQNFTHPLGTVSKPTTQALESLWEIAPKQEKTSQDLEKFAANKVIPETLKNEILEALSYYPELENTHIDFLFYKNIKGSVMQAQPKIKTMWFRNKSKRSYKVKISRHLHLVHRDMKVEEVPHDVLVGWIGHELGHIMDYRDRSNLAMACFGVNYVCSKRFLRKAERNADKYAISHGLSDYIIETKHFILDHAKFPKAYKEKIRELYMSPEDVIASVEEVEEQEDE